MATWEEIHGFNSPIEFERFVAWIGVEVAAGRAKEIPVYPEYDSGTIRGGRWYCNASDGETWQLVAPDFPFRGVWEPVPLTNRFIAVAAEKLRHSERDDASLRLALTHYLASGKLMNFAQGELIDHLGISAYSVLDTADFSDEEQEHVMNLLADLTDEDIENEVRSIRNRREDT